MQLYLAVLSTIASESIGLQQFATSDAARLAWLARSYSGCCSLSSLTRHDRSLLSAEGFDQLLVAKKASLLTAVQQQPANGPAPEYQLDMMSQPGRAPNLHCVYARVPQQCHVSFVGLLQQHGHSQYCSRLLRSPGSCCWCIYGRCNRRSSVQPTHAR